MKNKTITNVILILVLAFFAGNLVYPNYFNRSVDFLNSKLNWNLPHFWNKPFSLGLDLQGGAHLVYQADLSNILPADKTSAMEGLRDVIERRINYFGVSEPVVQVQEERLVVELAGVLDVSEAIKLIGQTPFLEFKEQKSNYEDILKNNQAIIDAGTSTATGTLEDPFQSTDLTGKYLQRADVDFDQTSYKPLVSLQFTDEGAKVFAEITSRNVGKILAIFIDGQMISYPTVEEEITGGKATITGNFTVEQTKELVRNLNAGALPVPISLISQQTVGPTLGKVSLDQSLKAGMLGFLAILIFLVIFYRLPGLFAGFALLIYIACLLSAFKLIPVTMTLAGIAGFLLSMGMAIDANILIFSRMREELNEGKTYASSLENGTKRAWPSIRDGNLTTILVGAILFALGTSFVKGFALTLIIGNIFGMFTSIVITNNFLRLFQGEKSKKWMWLWK
jgi:preprotein translocase subunit SecD